MWCVQRTRLCCFLIIFFQLPFFLEGWANNHSLKSSLSHLISVHCYTIFTFDKDIRSLNLLILYNCYHFDLTLPLKSFTTLNLVYTVIRLSLYYTNRCVLLIYAINKTCIAGGNLGKINIFTFSYFMKGRMDYILLDCMGCKRFNINSVSSIIKQNTNTHIWSSELSKGKWEK